MIKGKKFAVIGKSGAGKDYVTRFLIERELGNDIVRFAFADYVKNCVALLLGMNEEQYELMLHDEGYKNYTVINIGELKIEAERDVYKTHWSWDGEYMYTSRSLKDSGKEYDELCQELKPIFMTLREFIVYFGTFVAQRLVGRKVWCNSLFNSLGYQTALDEEKIIFITDVRFPHEYEECKKRGFNFIRVTASDENNLDNIAESFVDTFEADYTFVNTKLDSDTFYKNIQKLVDWMSEEAKG